MNENPYQMRFGVKTLLFAMLTCGAAFGVLSWQPPVPFFVIALCVPGFWMGLAVAFAASVIPGRSSVVDFVRVVLLGYGFVLAISCVGVAAVFSVFVFVPFAIH